jgi:hypothetical protein
MVRADLTGAALKNADLTEADIRHANLSGARLENVTFNGAKVAGLVGTGGPLGAVKAEWLDVSPKGDARARVTGAQIAALLSGLAAAEAEPDRRSPLHRYFGRGDSLSNAKLSFGAKATVEVDSFFQNCTLNLGEDTELVVGKDGVLADCTIIGGGRITVHGQFFEGAAPGIIGPSDVVVSETGALVASVRQSPRGTRFSFTRGSRLRVKIATAQSEPGKVEGRQP